MDARQYMIQIRERKNRTIKQMADLIGISEGLLRMIEEGAVTHPQIVLAIQNTYTLTDMQAEELLPVNRRPNGGEYDPDRYVLPCDDFMNFSLY